MRHALFVVIVILSVKGLEDQQATHGNTPVTGAGHKAHQESLAAQPPAQDWMTAMQKVYVHESHCLTDPEIRSDKDNPISCFCRDAIADARYVYFTYVLTGKDANLNGAFLALQRRAEQQCTRDMAEAIDASFIGNIYTAITTKDWKWSGPEVVRTYPPDDVIKRIKPGGEHGSGRWVPFTVQLVYRDAMGRVTRTEEYSSREFEPVFPEKP